MPEQNEEKTEQATPKKRQETLEKGNVPKSRELSTALLFITSVIFLYFYGPYMLKELQKIFIEVLQTSKYTLNVSSVYYLFMMMLSFSLKLLTPLMLVLILISVLSNVLQFGFIISSKALELKWERLDPIKGLGNLLSKRSLVELIKSLFKIIVVGYVAFLIIKRKTPEIVSLADADPIFSIIYMGKLLFLVAITIAIIILFMALLDLWYQRWQHEEDMKMSKKELKEEFKQMEGDPLIKQRIRSIQREMARRRMMEEVPHAEVVITNPTHYAVAIKYEMEGYNAPIVVAKGQNLIALRIIEIAKNNGVLVYEDPPLARTLHNSVDIGAEIPEDMYKAVAEILAFLYNLKKRVH